MNRPLLVVASAALVGLMGALSACTLLLPTDELIQPCTADEECEAGFQCQENACLPIDEDDGGEGEGEGEGE